MTVVKPSEPSKVSSISRVCACARAMIPAISWIAYRFHARDAHLVLSLGAREPIRFGALLDGEAPGPSHGVDVDEDGNGLLRDGRLYQPREVLVSEEARRCAKLPGVQLELIADIGLKGVSRPVTLYRRGG